MKILFVKPGLAWPRSSGHDVHTYYAMQACAALGHEIGLVTKARPSAEATAGLPLAFTSALEGRQGRSAVTLSGLQERFRSYWGVDPGMLAALRDDVRDYRPDAVVIVGLDALPFLGSVERAVRIWYAADEWIWHHLSLVQPFVPATYAHLKAAATKGLYERAYASVVDRAWVVSETERRAMRWLAGVRHVDIVPNGVDVDYYAPAADGPPVPDSAVFWGRLDFEPNIQGLEWFCREIWPAVRREKPEARFTIVGFKPGPEVRALTSIPGVELKPDLPDLRREVQRYAVVVLPFVSGGGIKNKLLEAASMALPIVCTRRALSGLNDPPAAALTTASSASEWVSALSRLWASREARAASGTSGRAWVRAAHSWQAAVQQPLTDLASMVATRSTS